MYEKVRRKIIVRGQFLPQSVRARHGLYRGRYAGSLSKNYGIGRVLAHAATSSYPIWPQANQISSNNRPGWLPTELRHTAGIFVTLRTISVIPEKRPEATQTTQETRPVINPNSKGIQHIPAKPTDPKLRLASPSVRHGPSKLAECSASP